MRVIIRKKLAHLSNASVVEFLQQVIGEMQILDSESFVQNLVVNFKKAVNNYQTAFCLQSTVSYTAEVQKCANLALRNYVVFRDIAFDSLKSGNPEQAAVAKELTDAIGNYSFSLRDSYKVKFSRLQSLIDFIEEMNPDKLLIINAQAEYQLIKESLEAFDEAIVRRNAYRLKRKAKIITSRMAVFKIYNALVNFIEAQYVVGNFRPYQQFVIRLNEIISALPIQAYAKIQILKKTA
ncbi:MAG: hypothetical protein IIU03_07745 [Bacteroidales bacterium]|nr:hypothetical protein [Bacteroidales bacterium]MBQ5540110.1 hypothetical protein [Bacteroidales bacterium]MBR4678208.1 hypothetical protein [Bacteroidales bacterium]